MPIARPRSRALGGCSRRRRSTASPRPALLRWPFCAATSSRAASTPPRRSPPSVRPSDDARARECTRNGHDPGLRAPPGGDARGRDGSGGARQAQAVGRRRVARRPPGADGAPRRAARPARRARPGGGRVGARVDLRPRREPSRRADRRPRGRLVTPPLSRRQARRQALMLLYQWDLSGQPIGSQYGERIDQWALELADDVAARAAELDARITAASEAWTADRLGAVERSALRVAIHELETRAIPAEVAINEAVAFAKRYASEEAARLVNGILGRIQREEAA